MRYFNWKRNWFNKTFSNELHDWLYFPDTDKLISFDHKTGLEVQMTPDSWQEVTRSWYVKETKELSVDQKLDKIIKLLEK